MHRFDKGIGACRWLLAAVFFCLVLLVLSLGVAGWKNGGYKGAQHGGIYHNYDYNVDYGTHDWLADFAVEKLISNPVLAAKWYDVEGNFFWTADRIKAYLHGTYGPDSDKVYHYTRYLQLIEGENDWWSHVITFNDYKAITFSGAADKATICGKAAVYVLQDGDCLTAAFLMGEMAHYIGDMSSYGNVYHDDLRDTGNRPINWNKVMTAFDRQVLIRTSGYKWFKNPAAGISGAWTSVFDTNDRTSVFWVDSLPLLIPYFGLDPGQFARMLAYNTYWGSDIPGLIGSYDWDWMCDALFQDNLYQSKYWPVDDIWHTTWTGTSYLFFAKLEEILNYGIKYIASALNWVVDNAGAWECKASGAESNPEVYANRYLSLLSMDLFIKVASFTGIYGTVFAITFSASKLEDYILA